MSELVKQIERWLVANEEVMSASCSLRDGLAGMILVYFKLHVITHDPRYKASGLMMLDQLSEQVAAVERADFRDGMAGIGWLIEWLAQNKHIEADTNELLADMDDELYKSVLYNVHPSNASIGQFTGRGLYFYRRLLSKNKNSSRYRMLCLRECLTLMTDGICDQLPILVKKMISCAHPHRMDEAESVSMGLIFLSLTKNSKLNANECKNIICETLNELSKYLLSKPVENCCSSADLVLIRAYYRSGILLNDARTITRARDMANMLQDLNRPLTERLMLAELRPETDAFKANDMEASVRWTLPDVLNILRNTYKKQSLPTDEEIFI
ncbi:lanthionine synthetase LanC family protein [Mucilaginibacter lutimaris]|uniref:Lanthionine synthetase LanC family protein n=1 Tax=Mucilaginibacter lutimaris TaxID=931629 RepID=A0ABW2Z8X3_9SPHI